MTKMRPPALSIGIAFSAATIAWWLPGPLPAQTRLTLPGEKLPSVEFDRTEFGDAVDYLRSRANEMLGKNGRSLNLVLIDPEDKIAGKAITFKLTNTPWATALKYACDLAGVMFEADYGTLVVGEKAAVQGLRLSRTQIRHSEGSAPLVQRLGAIPLTGIDFQGAHLGEIIEFLAAKTEPGPNAARRAPINFIIKENARRPIADRPVTLKLARSPLSEVLHFATGLSGCRYRIDANAVVIGDSADIARVPRPRITDRGAIFQRLTAAPVPSVDIAAGTSLEDLAMLIRDYSKDPRTFPGGINVIDSTGKELTTWSPLKLENVRLIDLVHYLCEISGTTYRIEKNALIIANDPQVKERPGDGLPPATSPSSGTGGLKFDP